MKIRSLISLMALLLAGCTTTLTPFHVHRPWVRVSTSQLSVETGASIETHASDETDILLGTSYLIEHEVQEYLNTLLTRRGFVITEVSPKYRIEVKFKSERISEFKLSGNQASMSYGRFTSATSGGAGSVSGLGISIASAVAQAIQATQTYSEQTVSEQVGYYHTLAITMNDADSKVVFEGESLWKSNNVDILQNIPTAIQYILSYLPSTQTVYPDVPALNQDRLMDYLRENCIDKWFSCPALPYHIRFAKHQSKGQYVDKPKLKHFNYIASPEAMPAYIDLIQTAEFALPTGNENFDNPMEVELWKSAILGATYHLGPEKKEVYALVFLELGNDAYIVYACELVSATTFEDFRYEVKRWEERVYDFYDWYR